MQSFLEKTPYIGVIDHETMQTTLLTEDGSLSQQISRHPSLLWRVQQVLKNNSDASKN